MKTDDLIALLATGGPAFDAGALRKRFFIAVSIGALSALLLVVVLLGVRPDIARASHMPLFWWKAALPAAIWVGALSMVLRLSRPGVTAGQGLSLVAAAVLAVWAASVVVLFDALPEARLSLLLGLTWRVCPLLIAGLSVPGFIAIFWALRGLAPTRLRAAGAAAGLLAGATSTLAYCLHCPEMGVPFWGCWYVLGMMIPTVVGALLGPRFLRW